MCKDHDMTDAGTTPNETRGQAKERIKRTHADTFWTLRNKLIGVATMNSALSLGISLVSVILAYIAFTSSGATQLELKSIDLRQAFQKRYDELVYDARPKVTGVDDAKIYYSRFWDLQLEEYQYWQADLIHKEIYATWMDFRRLEWRDNLDLKGVKYQEGWAQSKQILLSHDSAQRVAVYKKFTDFMDGVFAGKTETYVNGPK